MEALRIDNNGKEIAGSNYWQSEYCRNGYLYLSINASAFRLLCPAPYMVEDMLPGAKYVIMSFLAGEWKPKTFCAEWLVEDGTDNPYSIHLSMGQVDRKVPAIDVDKDNLIASAWCDIDGKPTKMLELPAYLQIVPRIPWLKKIDA